MTTRLIAYGLIALALAGAVGYGAHIVRKANRVDIAEAALKDAQASHAAYVEKSAKQLADYLAQAKTDRAADEALTARITALEGVAADLRRAVRNIPATVEKADDKGVVTARIAPDWWLCYAASLGGDATDTTACIARSQVNADLWIGEDKGGVQVPATIR